MSFSHFLAPSRVRALRSLIGVGAFLLLAIPLFALERAPREPLPEEKPAKEKASSESTRGKIDPGAIEVRFTDNSTMKMTLKEDKIEYMTPYGKLFIPITEIRRIEFATRIPEDVAKKIDYAIGELGSQQYRNRQAASDELFALKEKAYPALLRATKHNDPEIANRADEIITKIRAEVPEEQLEIRTADIIYTDSSKIAGKIEVASLKVGTFQFGDLQLKLADVRVVRSLVSAEPEPDAKNIEAGPPNLVNFQNNIGKTYIFRVTGAQNGSLWGTDVYTTDSTLAMAAVHVGLLQPGQTGLVKVTIMPSPPLFTASTRNGVTSSPYDRYPAAYRVHK